MAITISGDGFVTGSTTFKAGAGQTAPIISAQASDGTVELSLSTTGELTNQTITVLQASSGSSVSKVSSMLLGGM